MVAAIGVALGDHGCVRVDAGGAAGSQAAHGINRELTLELIAEGLL